MKIYVMSLPFDERDTGDYDYCTTLTRGLNTVKDTSRKIASADYITGSDIDGYDARKAQELVELVDKNRGGKTFDISLENFYSNVDRIKNAEIVIKHLSQFAGAGTVLNLQMRAPETGFLFTPEELQKIKSMGFKLCITCHEYELNSNRQ